MTLADIPPATPPVLGAYKDDSPIKTAQDWTTRRAPLLREALQAHVYGAPPKEGRARLIWSKELPVDGVPEGTHAEYWNVRIEPHALDFGLVLLVPPGEGPHKLVLQFAFCGPEGAFSVIQETPAPETARPDFCARLAAQGPPQTDDDYMLEMPAALLLEAGYAVAAFAPADAIPDDAGLALPVLERLSGSSDPEARLGAVAAWGWLGARAVDLLKTDPRIDPARGALIGHSRYGKAAVAAAALFPSIDLVWAHQSGTGGAALSRSPEGEAVENITGAFPHWFAPAFRGYADNEAALPVDQHQALALIAPRPVLLGSGTQDVWAGPLGTYRAAEGAAPAFELLTGRAVSLSLEDPTLESPIAYVLKDQRHGTTLGDWRRFLVFAESHFAR